VKPRGVVLILLLLLSTITYLDRVALTVAGTTIQKELGISVAHWGWVVSAFSVSYALFEIPSGALGDRIGQRAVLTRIVIWWSAFTALTGAAFNFWTLIGVRFLFGIGEAGAFPNGAAAIQRWFVVKDRARATSVLWAGSRLGGALTPLLILPIMQVLNWRAAMVLFGLIGAGWAIAWWTYFRDNPADKNVEPEYLAQLEKERGHQMHVSLPWSIALKSGNFWRILIMYFLYCLGSYFYLSWLAPYLEKGRGFEGMKNLFPVMAPFLVGLVGNLCGGAMSDWLNERYGLKIARRAVGGTGLIVSGMLMFACSQTPSNTMAVVCLALGYGAMDCMLPVSWAVCQDIGGRYSGAVGGAMNMAGQVGSFLLSFGFGYMVEYFGNYNTPLIPMSCALVVSGLLFYTIDPTQKLIPDSSPLVDDPLAGVAMSPIGNPVRS
jgi:MFS transporter, ACS family, glucarate transporter